MNFYQKHVFFCLNERPEGKKCCQNAGASQICEYTKAKIKKLGLEGRHKIRINKAGCMGRCPEGPVLVIYPEGVWYTYKSTEDIDEIIERHLLNGEIVKRLLLPLNAPQSTSTE